MFLRRLSLVTILGALNVGLAAWAGWFEPRPFDVLDDAALSRVEGGNCFATFDFPCDGVPVTCDNGTDVDPYPAGNCTKVGDQDYNCKWAGKERYKNRSRVPSYSDCLAGFASDAQSPVRNFACYVMWTCPPKCHNVNDPDWGVLWICDTGTDTFDAGNHTYTICSRRDCPE